MMIERYESRRISVDGETCAPDAIIWPEGVHATWRRVVAAPHLTC